MKELYNSDWEWTKWTAKKRKKRSSKELSAKKEKKVQPSVDHENIVKCPFVWSEFSCWGYYSSAFLSFFRFLLVAWHNLRLVRFLVCWEVKTAESCMSETQWVAVTNKQSLYERTNPREVKMSYAHKNIVVKINQRFITVIARYKLCLSILLLGALTEQTMSCCYELCSSLSCCIPTGNVHKDLWSDLVKERSDWERSWLKLFIYK